MNNFKKKLLISKLEKYDHLGYYRSLLDRYNDIMVYCHLLKDTKRKDNLTTYKTISLLKNKPFCQINKADIKKKYGNPNYYIGNKHPFEMEILFYRSIMGNHRANLDFHFHKNELFLYNYNFPYLNNPDRTEIVEVIESKYLKGEKFNFQNFNIIDNKDNLISINESLVFTISYICLASVFFENLFSFLEKQKTEEEIAKKNNMQFLYDKL
jgi:hypothetical protein